ncbi:hypothetical protein PMAYCL1PPCAC_12861 [Pristionchus mayeri]|uniref:E2 NEDD8-conjugating enzyme n=1 Tax=Pristionchus mayeri TaxID=1317129 RepID=A0AAN5CH48_9BILA|nr:hypothetical protein PMAYCL1PPCAC_12861 [Pristionchus mayeri]
MYIYLCSLRILILPLQEGKMLNLQKRIKGVDTNKQYMETRMCIREKLLTEEVRDMEREFKKDKTVRVSFPNIGVLHEMHLTVTPNEGFYKGGIFHFDIKVPVEYNHVPPVVKCLTRIWHPNIQEDGAICLSILRENSLDGFGWLPTRNISQVVHGLASLFGDLMDFEDPLNKEAADQFQKSRPEFEYKVRDYINRFARQ